MVATFIPADTAPPRLDADAEAFAARLARAAYEVALRHGIKGPFTDLELALWRAVRAEVGGRAGADAAAAPLRGPGRAGAAA